MEQRGHGLFGALAIDRPLDLEQCIDATDGLQRQGRDRRGRLAFGLATGTGFYIGEREERPARMCPAARFQDWSWPALGSIEVTVAAVSVGLEQARPVGEMP